MKAQYTDDGRVTVTLKKGETLAHMTGPVSFVIISAPGLIFWDALVEAQIVVAPAEAAKSS